MRRKSRARSGDCGEEMRAFGGNNTSGPIDVAAGLNAKGGAGRMDFESETFVTHSLRADGFDASEDGTGRGTPLVPVAASRSSRHLSEALLGVHIPDPVAFRASGQDGFTPRELAPPVTSTDGGGAGVPTVCVPILEPGAPMFTLQSGKQHAIAFSCKDSGADAGEIAPTLRAMPHDGSHANAGGQVAIGFYPTGGTHGVSAVEDGVPSLKVGSGLEIPSCPAVAFNLRGREHGSQPEPADVASLRAASGGSSRSYVAFHENQRAEISLSDTAGSLKVGGGKPGQGYPAIASGMAVRRLTTIECARLQGFPDAYLHIPLKRRKIDAADAAHLASHGVKVLPHYWQRKKVGKRVRWRLVKGQWSTWAPADGPQYKALGNSIATPVLRWIGERIRAVEAAGEKGAESEETTT